MEQHGTMPMAQWNRTYYTRPVRRWQVRTGDAHTSHHITVHRMPGGGWGIYSSLWSHFDVWLRPDVPTVEQLLTGLRAAEPDWAWTEVPATPYDRDLHGWDWEGSTGYQPR